MLNSVVRIINYVLPAMGVYMEYILFNSLWVTLAACVPASCCGSEQGVYCSTACESL